MTFEEFKKEAEPHFGQLILIHFEVFLLKGVSEDHYDNYYDCIGERNKVSHVTGCVRYSPLKERLLPEEYEILVNIWNLNHSEDDQAI